MKREEYINLIINNQLEELSKVHYLDNLVKYQYKNKYLIEYLLEKNIHSIEMDNYLKYNADFAIFYLNYNIIEPLYNCHLKTLLSANNGELILDSLLNKINYQDKVKLYQNIKKNSYWFFRDYEEYVVNIFGKHGLLLPKVFIHNKINSNNNLENNLLLEEFKLAYQDHSCIILDIIINELKNDLVNNEKYTIFEIKELIKYKNNHPNFKFIISNTSNGSFNPDNETLEITPYRKGVFTHEVSHLIFEENDNSNNFEMINEYEKLCDNIDNDEEVISKIVNYLKKFHLKYNSMRPIFEKQYYDQINKKYGTYEEYIKKVANDLIKSNADLISIEYDQKVGMFVDSSDIESIVSELLIIEKNEFVKNELNNYFTEELMLENLLDAILHGRILDDLLDVECLSGHSFFQFSEDPLLSFNECLADYVAIKNSLKTNMLLDDLTELIGNNIIEILDNYLEINRSNGYGR